LESKGLPPLLLTAIANSMFAVLLPVSFLSHYLYKRSSRNKWVEMTEDLSGSSQPQGALSRETKKAEREWTREKLRGLFLKALGLWPIWFLAIFAYNCSFLSTDVMSNTILSIGGTGLSTYALELTILKAKFSVVKLGAIVFCITGTILWTCGNYSKEKGESKSSFVGDMLCIVSALLYAVISVLIRKLLGGSSKEDMALFWGFTGLVNMLGSLPIVLVSALCGAIDLSNVTSKLYGVMMLKGLIDNLFTDYLWSFAVLHIGPTAANVGLSIETPIVAVVDLMTGNATYLANSKSAALSISGAIVILFGFVGLKY